MPSQFYVPRRLLAAVSLITMASVPLCARADDWPTFRGLQRTAVAPDTGLLQKWPAGGPKLTWETTGAGRGYASLAIAGDAIVTLGDVPSSADSEDGDEYLACFDRASGKHRWKTRTGPAWMRGKDSWQSSRSTPTIDGDRVYALTAYGELICCGMASGAERWRKNLYSDFEGNKADGWGYSESVLIDGDRLVCTPGSSKATMVALDKQTGELIWKAARPYDRGAGHASIVVAEVGGTRIYVQSTGSGPFAVRASDGKVLWTYDIERTTAVIPTPIVRGDLVFFVAGYKRGGALLRQVVDSDGQIRCEEVYPLKVDLANKHGGVVLVGDHLYGDSEDAGIPYCAELQTGKTLWKKRGSGKRSVSVAAADGRLYLRYSDGTMVLAAADPEAYVETSSFKIPGSGARPSWSHPVIVDGKLYLREHDRILCYDVRR